MYPIVEQSFDMHNVHKSKYGQIAYLKKFSRGFWSDNLPVVSHPALTWKIDISNSRAVIRYVDLYDLYFSSYECKYAHNVVLAFFCIACLDL